MNIDVFCPHCGTLFTVRRDVLGKRTKCTKCGNMFVIAEPAAAAAPAPAATLPLPTYNPYPEVDMSAPTPLSRTARPSFMSGEFLGFERDANQPRFPALRMVAHSYEISTVLALVFAAILLVIFVIAVIVAVIDAPGNIFQATLGALAVSGMPCFWAIMAIILAINLLFIAQSIRLGLQVEQNTRETRDACRQLAEHLCAIKREP